MLRRLSKFRLKKRNVVLVALCLLLVAIPVIAILVVASKNLEEEEVLDLVFGNKYGRHVVAGSGLNLIDLGSENLLINGSFEPLVYRKDYNAQAGDNKKIFFTESDELSADSSELPLDEFFEGADLEVLSTRGRELTLKKVSKVAKCEVELLPEFHPFSLPPDSPKKLRWKYIFENSDGETRRLILAANDGYVLHNARGDARFLQTSAEEDLIKIVPWQEGQLLLDVLGNIFLLKNDLSLKKLNLGDGKQVIDLESIPTDTGWNILLLQQDGSLVLREGADESNITPIGSQKCKRLFSHGENVFVVTRDNQVLYSQDLKQWLPAFSSEKLFELNKLVFWRDKILVLGTLGEAHLVDTVWGSHTKLPTGKIRDVLQAAMRSEKKNVLQEVTDINFKDGLMLSDLHIVLLDTQGFLYETKDGGQTWQVHIDESVFMNVDFVEQTSDQNIIVAGKNGDVGSTSLGITLVSESALEDGTFNPGDLVRLEKHSPLPWNMTRGLHNKPAVGTIASDPKALTDGEWYVSSQTTAKPTLEDFVSSVGRSSLHIQSLKSESDNSLLQGIYSGALLDNSNLITQDSMRVVHKLSELSLKEMQGNSAFELGFWAKSKKADSHVDIALTGPNMPDDSIRRYLTPEWRHYSIVMLIPWSVAERSDLRLVFDFIGSNEAFLDGVYLKKIDRESPFVDDLEKISKLSPDIIRLDYLQIGHRLLSDEFYHQSESQYVFGDDGELNVVYMGTLPEALQAVQAAEAQPWLCIGPSISESELRHLMEYLFGSRQSEYGQKRVQSGTMSRWNEVFDTIYLEFNDQGSSAFALDSERQIFVDWAIQVIVSTHEYPQVKNQIVFVDGMDYEDGVFLSSADSHAIDYGKPERVTTKAELLNLADERFAKILRDPTRASFLRPEMFRSMSPGGNNLRLADYMGHLMSGLGNEVIFSLPNMGKSDNAIDYSILQCMMKSSENILGLAPIDVQVGGQTGEERVIAYSFEGRNTSLTFVINLGEDVKLIRIPRPLYDETVLKEYDERGNLLSEKSLGRRVGTFALLPGAMLVLEQQSNPR